MSVILALLRQRQEVQEELTGILTYLWGFEASLGYTKQRKKDSVLLTSTLKLPPP